MLFITIVINIKIMIMKLYAKDMKLHSIYIYNNHKNKVDIGCYPRKKDMKWKNKRKAITRN